MRKNTFLVYLLLLLLISCEEESQYPLAAYEIVNKKGTPGFMHIADASASISFTGTKALKYRWDLNGDHASEWDTEWLDQPTLYFIFPETADAIIGLQVKDEMDQTTVYYNINHFYLGDYNFYIATWNVQNYSSITIHYRDIDQNWLKSNLRHADSTGIFNSAQSSPTTNGSYYTWNTSMELFNTKTDKEFPTSDDLWLIPSLDEWKTLIEYYGGEKVAGYNLTVNLEKSIQLSYSGIFRDNKLDELNEAGYYWTSTKIDDNHAFAIKVIPDQYLVETVVLPVNEAASVRLLIPSRTY